MISEVLHRSVDSLVVPVDVESWQYVHIEALVLRIKAVSHHVVELLVTVGAGLSGFGSFLLTQFPIDQFLPQLVAHLSVLDQLVHLRMLFVGVEEHLAALKHMH